MALLLADIGGYTGFLKMPKVSLLHAQALVDLLLSAVVRTPKIPLERGRTIGDSSMFFCRPDTLVARRDLIDSAARLLQSFVQEQKRIESTRTCDCSACEGMRNLRLKFVAHAGDVVLTPGRSPDLLGPPVILAHRLLKNTVPFAEYVLMTDAITAALPSRKQARSLRLSEQVEGFGRIPVLALPLDREEIALDYARASSAPDWAATTSVASRLVGGTLRHAALRDAGKYRNLPRPATGRFVGAAASRNLPTILNITETNSNPRGDIAVEERWRI